jgi:WD40 repeat protein
LDNCDRKVVSSVFVLPSLLTRTKSSCKCAVSQDGSKVVVSKEGEGFHLYSRGTGAQIMQFPIPAESSGEFTPVQFVHGDHFVAGGSEAGEVRLWDIKSGDRIQTLRDATGSIVDIAVRRHTETDIRNLSDHPPRRTTDLKIMKMKIFLWLLVRRRMQPTFGRLRKLRTELHTPNLSHNVNYNCSVQWHVRNSGKRVLSVRMVWWGKFTMSHESWPPLSVRTQT